VDDLRAGGLKGFVQKPFNSARLGRAVRQALDE
jgi:FixJ family two-component response regulator